MACLPQPRCLLFSCPPFNFSDERFSHVDANAHFRPYNGIILKCHRWMRSLGGKPSVARKNFPSIFSPPTSLLSTLPPPDSRRLRKKNRHFPFTNAWSIMFVFSPPRGPLSVVATPERRRRLQKNNHQNGRQNFSFANGSSLMRSCDTVVRW